jgi:hypothetical protein
MEEDSVQPNSWTLALDEPARVLIIDGSHVLLGFGDVHLSSPNALIETARISAALAPA